LQQKLNQELEKYFGLVRDERLDVVRSTLQHLELIGEKFPAFIGWVIGEVWVNNRGQVDSDKTLEGVCHRSFIELWMIGWLAKNGNLWLREISELDLRNYGVNVFPSSFQYLENLRSLRLEGNPLLSLWSSVEQVSIDQHQLNRLALISSKLDVHPEVSLDFSGFVEDDSIPWDSLESISNDVVSLRISNPAMEEIPSWVQHFSVLRKLDLSGSKLTVIPEWLGEMNQLKVLNIGEQCHRNRVFLPDSLQNLVELQSLGLRRVGLSVLPEWIESLIALQSLQLYGNDLKQIPDWVRNLRFLNDIELAGNPLHEVPQVLCKMPTLEKVVLHLLPDENGFTQRHIAEELSARCPDIEIKRRCAFR